MQGLLRDLHPALIPRWRHTGVVSITLGATWRMGSGRRPAYRRNYGIRSWDGAVELRAWIARDESEAGGGGGSLPAVADVEFAK